MNAYHRNLNLHWQLLTCLLLNSKLSSSVCALTLDHLPVSPNVKCKSHRLDSAELIPLHPSRFPPFIPFTSQIIQKAHGHKEHECAVNVTVMCEMAAARNLRYATVRNLSITTPVSTGTAESHNRSTELISAPRAGL